jgi:hypothetical protein
MSKTAHPAKRVLHVKHVTGPLKQLLGTDRLGCRAAYEEPKPD